MQLQSFGIESDINIMVAAFKGENYPEQAKIFLDAEKALIKAMKPVYTKELFNAYPISKDSLYIKNYDAISYTFTDPITLVYKEGQISGGLTTMGGDSIVITTNKDLN